MGTSAIIALMTTLVSTMLSLYFSNSATKQASQDQMDLLEKQQDFNSNEAQLARDYVSEPQRFERMTTQLGFNPDLAAASIMGAPQNSGYAASSPNAPQVPNLAQSLSGLLSDLPEDALSALMQPVQADNLQAQTNKINTEIEWMPLSYESQLQMWDSYAAEAKSKAFLNNGPMYELYQKQADFVVPLSQAQVSVYRSQVSKNIGDATLAFEKSLTEDDLRDLYNAEAKEMLSRSFLNGKMSFYYDQLATKTAQDTMVGYAQEDLLKTDNALRLYQALSAYYDVNLRSKMAGLPWSDDLSKNLFIMQACGGEAADMAKTMENELFAGMRRLNDLQVDMNMEHFWENFLQGFSPNSFVPSFYLGRTIGGAYSKSPKGSPRVPKTANGAKGGLRYDSYGNVLPSYNFSGGSSYPSGK